MILREKECALNACVQIFCMTIHIISVLAVSLNVSRLSKKADGLVFDLHIKAQIRRIVNKSVFELTIHKVI